jgi:hypothetical protein
LVERFLVLQPHLVIDEALLALVVAVAGSGLVASSPSGPADSVAGGMWGLVQVGVQTADLVDGEWDELAGFVIICDVGV